MQVSGGATFPRLVRLRHAREFRRVRSARLRKDRGPLFVSAAANGLGRSRLGLSIGRRAGNAVARNGYKRLLREGFRLARAELDREPVSVDLVVGVRPHERLGPEAYRDLILDAARAIRREMARREKRGGGFAGPHPSPSVTPPPRGEDAGGAEAEL